MLRRKLENNPSNPNLIISRPGIGYMLVSTSGEANGN
jgi:DNA-binding response OmpR family regulator